MSNPQNRRAGDPASVTAVLAVVLAGPLAAQSPQIDTYWQRESGIRVHDNLQPFRAPSGLVGQVPSSCEELIDELTQMRRLAKDARPDQLTRDAFGREICNLKTWTDAFERVKAKGLRNEGWLGKVFMEDSSRLRRSVCAYGMYYFNNAQHILNLIAMLPGEPVREIREDGMVRALEFLRVHLPKSQPQNPKDPTNGVVVPTYNFNPLPFFQLLDAKDASDRAQGLWFLANVLRIRHDLGRAYFGEIKDRLPALLLSDTKPVRSAAVDLLAEIDRNKKRVRQANDSDADLREWFTALDYELFPPIRHVSSGLVELYPSKDLREIGKVGKRSMVDSFFPRASVKTKTGKVRYGIRVPTLPDSLKKLGIPDGAVLVGVNGEPVSQASDVLRIVSSFVELHQKAQAARAASGQAKAPAPRRAPALMVEYVEQGVEKLKEFRLMDR
ncbi:MAG: hypothetical protein H6836_02515 [Planctomycetes bacterium]|nr:hypothetical protein [Planctomycetota bacterium]